MRSLAVVDQNGRWIRRCVFDAIGCIAERPCDIQKNYVLLQIITNEKMNLIWDRKTIIQYTENLKISI